MKSFFLLVISCLISLSTYSRTCISTGSGNWESSGSWLCDGVPSIPMAGDNVIIQASHTITQTTNHTPAGSGPMYIYVYGTWNFGNGAKIYLPCNSGVSVEAGGSVTASGGGSSNRIEICNVVEWKASDGDITSPSTIGTSPPGNPLPVELLSFKGSTSGKVVELDWVTATEINSSHFLIQRSTDGVNYSEISRVEASGNSDIPLFYYYLDQEPREGNNYYRLLQADYDGKTKLSDVVAVRIEDAGSTPVIFPNPAGTGSYLTFSWDGFNDTGAVVSVYDNTGRLVYSSPIMTPSSRFTLPVSEMNISTGTYFVRFVNGTSEKQVPLIIQK